ncbi:MAG: hypothetical protein WC360_07555, partial [Opitutales bacterium]
MKSPLLILTASATVLIFAPLRADFRQLTEFEFTLGGGDSPPSYSQVGRVSDSNTYSQSTSHDGNFAIATNNSSWDINPAQGYISYTSNSSYNGWTSSGVGIDTRVVAVNYDTFRVLAGSSGLNAGAAVTLTLRVSIDASASTDALKFQTG